MLNLRRLGWAPWHVVELGSILARSRDISETFRHISSPVRGFAPDSAPSPPCRFLYSTAPRSSLS